MENPWTVKWEILAKMNVSEDSQEQAFDRALRLQLASLHVLSTVLLQLANTAGSTAASPLSS